MLTFKEFSAEEVVSICKMSASEFSSWFQAGFRDIASGDRSRLQHAFRPLHLLVSPGDPEGDLEAVYNALHGGDSGQRSAAQENFCEGLADAFSVFVKDQDYSNLSPIFLLAQRIKARELIEHIEPMAQGIEQLDKRAPLLKLAMGYLVSVAKTPDSAVVHVIKSLVDSDHFDSVLCAQTFTTLCLCNPDLWLEHLALLRPHFAKYENLSLAITSKLFVSRVPLNLIAEKIMCLDLAHNGDRCLLEALVLGDDCPLVVSQCDNDNALMLSCRKKGSSASAVIKSVSPNPAVEDLLRQASQRVESSSQCAAPIRMQGKSIQPGEGASTAQP